MATTTSSVNTSSTNSSSSSNTSSSNTSSTNTSSSNVSGPNISLGFTYDQSISFGENLYNFYKEVLNEDNVNKQKIWIRKLKAGAAVEVQNNPGFNNMYVDTTGITDAKAEKISGLTQIIKILIKNKYPLSELMALKTYLDELRKPTTTPNIVYPKIISDKFLNSPDEIQKLYRGNLMILTDYKSYEDANYEIDKLVMKNYNKYYQYYVFNIKVEGQNYLESLAEDFEKEIQRKKNLVFSEFINMMNKGISGTYVNYYNVNQLGKIQSVQNYMQQRYWTDREYRLFFTPVDNKGYKKWKAWALDKKEAYKTIPMLELSSQSINQLKDAIKAAKDAADFNLQALKDQLTALQNQLQNLQTPTPQQVNQIRTNFQSVLSGLPQTSNNNASSPNASSSNASNTAQTSAPKKTVQDYLDQITSWKTNLEQIQTKMRADTGITKTVLDTSLDSYFKPGKAIWQTYLSTRNQKINVLLNFQLMKNVDSEVQKRTANNTTQLTYEDVFEKPDKDNGNYQEITGTTAKFLMHLRNKKTQNVVTVQGGNDKSKLLPILFTYILNGQGFDGETYQINGNILVNEKPRIPVYSDYEEFTDVEYEDYTDEEYGEFVDKLDQEVTQIIQEEGATLNGSESGSYDMSGSESGSYELSGSESGSY